MKAVLVLLATMTAQAFAGWDFVSETRSTDGKGNVVQKMIVKSSVEGEHGKFVFEEAAGSPMTKTGNYMITNDGGKTMFIVDPVNKTYSPFDLDSMMKLAGNMMNMVQGMVKMEFSDPQIEVLEERKGKEIQGMSTTYRKSRTTYEMRMKILGMSRVMDVDTVEEVWFTKKLKDTAFGAWLKNDPAPTGNEDLDRLILSQVKAMDGYPLKLVQTSTTTTWNKKKTKMKDKQVTQHQTVVTQMEKKSFKESHFQIPEGYVRGESPEEQSGLGSLKDMLKGND